VEAAVERSAINTSDVNEIILGNVVSAGVGQALPRQVSIGAGIPPSVGGVAINKVCGSGLKAVMLASNAICANDGDLFIAGVRKA
jgi:acetyl-CoA C-acetyltransferase